MAWDSKRDVPWKRLFVEWAVVAVAIAVITLVFTKGTASETVAAIVMGGAIYFAVGAVLAKLGYARKSLRQLRAESALAQQAAAERRSAGSPSGGGSRPRPAPTKRTSSGPSQHPRKKRR